MDDLTVSLPVSGYNSLPTTPEHKYLRTGSLDTGTAAVTEEADGNTMSMASATRSLTRGTR